MRRDTRAGSERDDARGVGAEKRRAPREAAEIAGEHVREQPDGRHRPDRPGDEQSPGQAGGGKGSLHVPILAHIRAAVKGEAPHAGVRKTALRSEDERVRIGPSASFRNALAAPSVRAWRGSPRHGNRTQRKGHRMNSHNSATHHAVRRRPCRRRGHRGVDRLRPRRWAGGNRAALRRARRAPGRPVRRAARVRRQRRSSRGASRTGRARPGGGRCGRLPLRGNRRGGDRRLVVMCSPARPTELRRGTSTYSG